MALALLPSRTSLQASPRALHCARISYRYASRQHVRRLRPQAGELRSSWHQVEALVRQLRSQRPPAGRRRHNRMCEDCGLKRASFGAHGTKWKRWCGGCARSGHPHAVDVTKHPSKPPAPIKKMKLQYLMTSNRQLVTFALTNRCIYCNGLRSGGAAADDCVAATDAEHNAPGGCTRKRRKTKEGNGRQVVAWGKWWRDYGYRGGAYCQRCSEVFRAHLLREKSNSAKCSRAHPCVDCAKILVNFPFEPEKLWERVDAKAALLQQKKKQRKRPNKRRASAAAKVAKKAAAKRQKSRAAVRPV
eukprot:SAG31_NODE_5226_length_2662_cov_1.657956_4_plen_302_part_00